MDAAEVVINDAVHIIGEKMRLPSSPSGNECTIDAGDAIHNSRSKQMPVVMAAFIALAVISVIILIVGRYRKETGNRHMIRSCASNLKNIMIMVDVYAQDWGGIFPPLDGAAGLEILRANGYFANHKVYLCPSTSSSGRDGAMLTEDTVGYHYFGGYQKTDGKDIPIMLDKQGNHHKYVNVAYSDGSVTGFAGINAWDEQYSKARKMHDRIVGPRRLISRDLPNVAVGENEVIVDE